MIIFTFSLQCAGPLQIGGNQQGVSAQHTPGREQNELTLPLPSGTGLSKIIRVEQASKYSQRESQLPSLGHRLYEPWLPFAAYALLDYAAPTITRISGCAINVNATTSGCKREGGDVIEIEGFNFGRDGALVVVGAKLCKDVVHDSMRPHNRLTCRVPLPPMGADSKCLLCFVAVIGLLAVMCSAASACGPGRWRDEHQFNLGKTPRCSDTALVNAANQTLCSD